MYPKIWSPSEGNSGESSDIDGMATDDEYFSAEEDLPTEDAADMLNEAAELISKIASKWIHQVKGQIRKRRNTIH